MTVHNFAPFQLTLFKRCRYFETEDARYGLLIDCQGGELNVFCHDKETDSSCTVILGKARKFRREYFHVRCNEERFYVRYEGIRVTMNFKNYTCASTGDYPAFGMGEWGKNALLPWEDIYDDLRYPQPVGEVE